MSSRITVSFLAVSLLIVLQYAPVARAVNGGRLYALSFFNLTGGGVSSRVFEQIAISCFMCQTTVRVSVPSIGFTKIYTLDHTKPGGTGWYTKVQFNDTDIATSTNFPVGLKWSNLAVLVSSLNASISVQVNKAISGSGAAYLAIPITWESNYYIAPEIQTYSYYIASYTNQPGHSVVSVVSLFNDTCVSIDRMNADGKTFVRLQSFTLQANDVFNMYDSTQDLTGVVVKTRKPLAVFGGSDSTQIPTGTQGIDAIMEQMPKGSLLKTRYILTSIPGRPYDVGFRYRIIGASSTAINNDVRVYEFAYDSSTSTYELVYNEAFKLAQGSFIELVGGNKTGRANFTVVVVYCGKTTATACLIAEYNVGDQAPQSSGTSFHSDPAMVTIPPLGAFTQDITFSTSSVNDGSGPVAAANYLTIYASLSARDTLTLDGNLINTYWPTATSWTLNTWYNVIVPDADLANIRNYYVTTVGPIADGFHTLTTYPKNNTGDLYMAIVHGFGYQQQSPTAYSYLAGFDIPSIDNTPNNTVFYDMTQPPTAADVNAQITTSSPTGSGSSSNTAAPSEPSPSFGIIFLVNFTAIDPAASGKVPDRRCSINYGKYFIHQVVSLAENIAAVSRPTWFKFDGPNSYCANSAINVTVSVKNISSNVYFSEYSRSAGFFAVNISGYGDATLSDIYLCAAQLKVWIQDPNNWIEYYNGKTTNFLDLQNAKNYDFTEDLTGCSPLYVSNPDGKLTVYAQNWVCPLSSASVFGSATSRYKPTSSAHVIMALIFAFTLLLR